LPEILFAVSLGRVVAAASDLLSEIASYQPARYQVGKAASRRRIAANYYGYADYDDGDAPEAMEDGVAVTRSRAVPKKPVRQQRGTPAKWEMGYGDARNLSTRKDSEDVICLLTRARLVIHPDDLPVFDQERLARGEMVSIKCT